MRRFFPPLAGHATSTTKPVTVAIAGAGDVRVSGTVQFTATVANAANTAVTWEVNGVKGGSAATGTISSTGLYKAPATVPSPSTVNITAVSQAATGVFATAVESIQNPVPAISSATAVQNGIGANVTLDVLGTNFVSGAEIKVGGVAVTTTLVSATELAASTGPSTGATSLSIAVENPNPGSATTAALKVPITRYLATIAAASRLLDQATFGPTLADIHHVQSIGLDAYINEQFASAATIEPDIANPPPTECTTTPIPCQQSEWWKAALTGPDQLRQRVAFAFSEMFVVSTNSVNANAVIPYENMLARDAFGNFSTLLHDVTLSTAMGAYLNMLNSAKPGTGQIANENYAREAMQLFTIGLYELNQDGTPKLSGGNTIPTYTQAQVQAFARAYTGWTYAAAGGGSPTKFPNPAVNYDAPMAPVESEHDLTAKTLLNGTTLPANQTAVEDLNGALANLFAQENVAPFVCRQLIQHLVSSNPSPAYVGRVSAVFNNNGSGVRGDLKAVIRAILEDEAARAGDTEATAPGGHLREPILYLTDVMRGLGYVNTASDGYYGSLSGYSGNLSEKPYASGSVFNFFPPNYEIPGTTGTAPEFDLENTGTAILRLSLANSLVFNGISGFSVNLSATSPLGLMAASSAGDLVDALNVVFMHGQMPAGMRTEIVKAIAPLTNTAERVRVATYLVITSSLFKVEH